MSDRTAGTRRPSSGRSRVAARLRPAALATVCAVVAGGCAIPPEPGSLAASRRAAQEAAAAPAPHPSTPGEAGGAGDASLSAAPRSAGTQARVSASTTAASGRSGTSTSPAAVRARARTEVRALSTRRLAAQIVVPDAGSVDAGVRGIAGGYGGVVVMRSALTPGPRVATAAKAANRRYAAAMTTSRRSWPAFVAIDQEGGPVTRLDAPLTPFPAAMALGAARDHRLATEVARASGRELAGLGFTVVMAPDADVTTPADRTIGVRSPGGDPAAVSRVARSAVTGYRQAGILPVVKHFPGHGAVAADTHRGTAVLTASRPAMNERDLVPFRDLVRAGAPAVMTSHVVARAVDPTRPASQSRAVTTHILRRDLRFSGLVVTDALNMGAATAGLAPGEETVRAVEAGADIALMPADPAAAVGALEKAVRTGRLDRARLEESAVRMIVALRSRHATVAPAAPGSNGAVARKLAAASITQVGGRCGRRLVGRAVMVSGGTAEDRARFVRSARARGLRIGGPGATRVVLLGGGAYRAGSGAGSGASTGSGDVLVALDTPYGLARGRARARLATYGRTPATFDALVDVLLARAGAPGRLPVAVGSWRIGTGCG
ncbi:glycoside hydrolase family 3 N-terminal domain-containing protein [Mobilicoccus pelagius]|uniref:beta-N-acetylhexosaminidase n=1 Tax=Mobilicoccus pelagius NBRC 104925 TaxID=1089455 RepID=H5UQE0_9MICO|nr:glycoside hydrolase family 3 N-terminal domain-containing protein [Mobilicoccus pelagius]GAB47948.1 putative beta-N-acetylhexosaminidase [Mobilicoccus pelagius NBRC 104925]